MLELIRLTKIDGNEIFINPKHVESISYEKYPDKYSKESKICIKLINEIIWIEGSLEEIINKITGGLYHDI